MVDLEKQGKYCIFCLYLIRAGLDYWCLENDTYTDFSDPACDKFIPNASVIKEYERRIKK